MSRPTLMRNRFTGETFRTRNTADYFGSSNRTSDGTPMYEPEPDYRVSNPKIDLYGPKIAGYGSAYLASTNQFQTCREALQYFSTRPIKGVIPARAFRSRID